MQHIISRIKGMIDPVVLVSVAFFMMVITLLLTYHVLCGNVLNMEIATRILKIIIVNNLILYGVVGIRFLIPVFIEIHRNGFISLIKLSDEDEEIE